ncbi:MAG: YtxH domain-containing protein [Cytophagales bacterium]|jgi:gas vesicle protein|nr:YtxH domain-containing protein [Cytophagales bacterium]MCA6387722.1 YtxH domain-containing protein [Cytophagales bacterium]MCA6393333.1 YtxH domain-containing protein [Cytophagales bacterium]MCA6394950.1 YtxH domain-containing protein [Cytophagales bacterium]MCA6398802.1 YtxH domain-containing protein [Cytophagales bacterium]
MNTTSKVLTGVLVGASVGIIAGILIAPDSGKHTREKIVGKTKDLKNLMTDSMADVKNAYNREIESLMNNGKSGIDSMKNALKV